MLKNYIKIALKNIMNSKLYSFLNIIGLAIGLAGVILIALYTYNELSYEHYHDNYKRIYRISSDFVIEGKEDHFAQSSLIIGPLFKQEYSEVEDYGRLIQLGKSLFIRNNKSTFIQNTFYADPSILQIFKHEFIYGDPKTALTGINKIVLSEEYAQKFFGDENPLNQVITSGNGVPYQVTGVFKNYPDNIHIKYDALASIKNQINRMGPGAESTQNLNGLWNVSCFTYILLKENSNFETFHKKTDGFYNKYMAELGKQINAKYQPNIQQLVNTHFEKLEWDVPQGKKEYIMIFIIVGIFLITIASINYMNLATARSAKRAKEVGLRKVVGAQKSQLISQFLIESIILALIALFLAFIMVELILPVFNQLAEKKLSFDSHTPWWIFSGIFIITILIGLGSGSYPAFFLSSYQPAIVIKGEATKGKKGKLIRQILVVFQFSLSIIMIIGTLIVIRQLNFLKTHDLGYKKENLIFFQALVDSAYVNNYNSFRSDLLKDSDILGMATSTNEPIAEQGKLVFPFYDKGKTINKPISFLYVDASYIPLMGIKFSKGENFQTLDGTTVSGNFTNNTFPGYIINESAARLMGWEKNPIGQLIGDPSYQSKVPVIGMVKDFNYNTLHNPVEPLIILPSQNPLNYIYIRIKAGDPSFTVAKIEKTWLKYFTRFPFEYKFLEDNIEEKYLSESRLVKVFGYFAIMCIFIACLGLLGLATFAAQQRTKEIGIRKVMGGSIKSIILLLTKDFSKLVLISNLIAWPVSYYLMSSWLNNFPYHISVPILSFLYATVIAFFIAWLTVGLVAYRTATANPVDALRYE